LAAKEAVEAVEGVEPNSERPISVRRADNRAEAGAGPIPTHHGLEGEAVHARTLDLNLIVSHVFNFSMTTQRRVRVYELDSESNWVDKGIGHVEVEFVPVDLITRRSRAFVL
jgi:hypothetical protein